ncbi:MAG: von Willebrand factor type A domain-containing protein [Calditrichia bacterium]
MKKLLLLLLMSTAIVAGDYGSVEGFVRAKTTGDVLHGANVHLGKTKFVVTTDSLGYFRIENVPVGRYMLRVDCFGYHMLNQLVRISANSSVRMDVNLIEKTIESERVFNSDKETPQMQNKEKSRVFALATGVFEYKKNSVKIEDLFGTEEYSRITESGFREVIASPMSTFAADVDAASYANARRFIMRNQMPHPDVVRTEEFVNYFDYDYPQPEGDHPLSINIEYGECPWNSDNQLVHIGLRGKEIAKSDQKASNLVFLIDVSGSMKSPDKLPLLKESFKMLVDNLSPEDRIAMVVYAGNAGLVLPATDGNEKRKIIDALDELQAGGSTAGGEGIQLAYKVAKENFIKNGNNRVILATDGDFNVGISNTAELVRFIEKKRDDGIFLTVLGFGSGNYKDNRLQELADRGNGNHAYIDNILEAKKVLVNEITATLFTIAKDVKIQVEFNPAKVKSYRLIGYENRRLNTEDFTDDKKDAGEIGAGHTVTALYEIVPANAKVARSGDNKYTQTVIKKVAFDTDEVLTVRIRYKAPDGDVSKEFSNVLGSAPQSVRETGDNFRFSAAVAEFAMLLRDSEFKANASLASVYNLAKSAKGNDPFGYRAEFISLVERADILTKNRE